MDIFEIIKSQVENNKNFISVKVQEETKTHYGYITYYDEILEEDFYYLFDKGKIKEFNYGQLE